jgi:hypothetical protein
MGEKLRRVCRSSVVAAGIRGRTTLAIVSLNGRRVPQYHVSSIATRDGHWGRARRGQGAKRDG